MNHPTLAGTILDRYYHVCALFNSRDEEYAVLGPFFKEGLEWGEKEMHIVDPALIDDHVARLEAHGIAASACIACEQLQILPWDEAYLAGGSFDQDRMLETVESLVTAGRDAGYPRLRIMGNMGWALDGVPDSERLIEYEARVNDVLARNRQPAICVYDMAHLSGSMMMDILRSHPLTLVAGVVNENPFYTPPDMLLPQLRARARARGNAHATAH
ncbi:MAG TPA: MEDS domain-containing protein [Casimicrobiaceae bacterium]|nr:MEDS domain-containing protein [Casimicrobiaceae bacterium]